MNLSTLRLETKQSGLVFTVQDLRFPRQQIRQCCLVCNAEEQAVCSSDVLVNPQGIRAQKAGNAYHLTDRCSKSAAESWCDLFQSECREFNIQLRSCEFVPPHSTSEAHSIFYSNYTGALSLEDKCGQIGNNFIFYIFVVYFTTLSQQLRL
jgi:hypothetical protein